MDVYSFALRKEVYTVGQRFSGLVEKKIDEIRAMLAKSLRLCALFSFVQYWSKADIDARPSRIRFCNDKLDSKFHAARALGNGNLAYLVSFWGGYGGISDDTAARLPCYEWTNQALADSELFLNWTHRSKGRGSIDLAYFEVGVMQESVGNSSSGRGQMNSREVEADLPFSSPKSPRCGKHPVAGCFYQGSRPKRAFQDPTDDRKV